MKMIMVFFDYIDIYNSKFAEMNHAIEGITKATTTVVKELKDIATQLT
jgi:hypothetical protein